MILTREEDGDTMSSSDIKAEYTSSLADLTCNSKPLISVLTILADENQDNAADIVAAIEEHLAKVPTDVKLPILYLVDCIAKNVGGTYRTLFSQNIVSTFCNVFRVVNEKTRAEMFKLRQTWNDIFPQMKLYAIDVRINMLDPAWPVTALPPSNSIHFNPKFLKTSPNSEVSEIPPIPPKVTPTTLDTETYSMQQKLIQKQKELIELQQKKLELELLQTQVKLQKQLNNTKPGPAGSLPVPVRGQGSNILLKPEVAKQLIPGGPRDNLKIKPIAGGSQRSGGAVGKIAPANRALVAAAGSRLSRDPRLARQQTNNGTTTPVVPSGSTEKSKVFPKPKQSEQKPTKLRNKSGVIDLETKTFNKSSSSQDLPTKRKIDKVELKSPNKSPSRHKKKEYVNDKKNFKRERDTKSQKSEPSPPTFKGVKTVKSRNYIRRNRSDSYSPELNQDVDLRVNAPEKHTRTETEDKIECAPSTVSPKNRPNNSPTLGKTAVPTTGKDVDLRQLPAVVAKKRLSSETLEQIPSKKTKMFDVLFGNEDTDLRKQMPVVPVERPPTPPPPIISLAEKDSPKKSSNLDAIRAKLATATGRDKIMAKSFRKKRPQEDEDLRIIPSKSTVANESLKKIIISSDDEQCIKAGTMTKEQEKQLMNKIIAQIEHQKLKEAQRKDKEESVEPLQTVSDEDVETVEENDTNFGDKDDRVNYTKFPRENRESRRGGPYWRGGKRRPWENPHMGGPHPRPGLRPWMHPNNAWRPMGPNFGRPVPPEFGPGPEQDGKKSPEVPGDLVVDSVNQDDIKTINIDGIPRDIRYYDETAIVFMNWDDPKEISFQNGTRRVVFDDKDTYFLSFNEGYKELSINGTLHRVRLGAPSREIFINGKPYECYFGGPGITIDLNSNVTTVKMDGPPPQVKIGNEKRVDLVAGKVNLIIDAKILVPVFLDAKVQKFVIDGETHTLKFVDALKTVLINDVPFNVEFGGLPKPITVHDKKHFIRFSVLPRGVKPGSVAIKDMEGSRMSASPTIEDNSQDGSSNYNHDINEPALPVVGRKKKVEDDRDNNSNSPHFFQSFMQQNNLDVLSSVMTSIPPSASSEGYQVETLNNPDSQSSQTIIPQLPASININELFQKLVATGIVATSTKEPEVPIPPVKPTKRTPIEHMKPVTFNRPESLKVRQSQLYDALYTGMQCSSCGMRFPPEQSMHYSQHLDWHFRQNRKGKKNIRVAASRRWYYSLSDWKNYEEIEDLEEREKNYFDQQQSQVEGAGEEGDEEVEIPSVPADPDTQDAQCDVCQDKFDLFFNEEKEEWHLRNAIRVDDRTYHPICHEDYRTSLLQRFDETMEESIEEQPVRGEAKCDEQNIPGLEIIVDDDDEEMEEKKEVVIEESDESKPEIESKVEENREEDDDDDVIINEVVPEKIEVDDDREYVSTHEPPVIKIEQIDDGFMDVEEGLLTITNGGQIKIKSEPIDPDDLVMAEEVEPHLTTDTTRTGLISSMDGNTELTAEAPAPAVNVGFTGGKIKINISKPLLQLAQKEPKDVHSDTLTSLDPVIDPSQPLPPGEEPIQLNIKPALRGVELKKRPPVKKGSELTGMCSIM